MENQLTLAFDNTPQIHKSSNWSILEATHEKALCIREDNDESIYQIWVFANERGNIERINDPLIIDEKKDFNILNFNNLEKAKLIFKEIKSFDHQRQLSIHF